LFEMSTMCSLEDGYGFHMCVYGSGDEPGNRDEHLPRHAHVFAQMKPRVELGCVDLSNENPPQSAEEVIDADKKRRLPASTKKQIVKWANAMDEEIPSITNWEAARSTFWRMNKRLFPKKTKAS